MASMSCAHPNQSKHTRSFGSNYKHSVAATTAGDKLETLWHTEWYLRWGWFPTQREVVVYTNKKYDC